MRLRRRHRVVQQAIHAINIIITFNASHYLQQNEATFNKIKKAYDPSYRFRKTVSQGHAQDQSQCVVIANRLQRQFSFEVVYNLFQKVIG